MVNQKVRINGEEYGVWYIHRHHHGEKQKMGKSLSDALALDNFMENLFKKALDAGQVKVHAIDNKESLLHAIFNGVTVCQLERKDKSVASTGYAFCSYCDNFSKETGRRISLARAIEWAKKPQLQEKNLRKQLEHELRKLEYLQDHKLATWDDKRRIFETRRQLARMDFENQESKENE